MDFIYHTPGCHREMTMILKSGGRTKLFEDNHEKNTQEL
jgi:hypothetical protein